MKRQMRQGHRQPASYISVPTLLVYLCFGVGQVLADLASDYEYVRANLDSLTPKYKIALAFLCFLPFLCLMTLYFAYQLGKKHGLKHAIVVKCQHCMGT